MEGHSMTCSYNGTPMGKTCPYFIQCYR